MSGVEGQSWGMSPQAEGIYLQVDSVRDELEDSQPVCAAELIACLIVGGDLPLRLVTEVLCWEAGRGGSCL